MSNKSYFIGGTILGVILGVLGAIFWKSEKGVKMRKELREKASDFYETTESKLKEMKDMGEKEFSEFIENAASKYAGAKKLTEDELKILKEDAKATWKRMKDRASDEN